MTLLLNNFRIVDEYSDFHGSVRVEGGLITEVREGGVFSCGAETVIDGGGLVLMPAFVDLHAHFRDSGGLEGEEAALPAETIESACLAAAAGGYGAVVCMANTRPAIDTLSRAARLRARAEALGLIDLYPALSVTKGMEGAELSEFPKAERGVVPLVSEDGRDIARDAVFTAAIRAARNAGLVVSCHCDLGGEDAATERAIRLARRVNAEPGGPVKLHIAHVSTARAAALIRAAKQSGMAITCEATPHHMSLTERDAAALGAESFGKVAPPLRAEGDRAAIVAALVDGTIDAIATDHAPHSPAAKRAGAPGFSGLETAFAVSYGALAAAGKVSLSRLSRLLSAAPARILGLAGRGRVAPGFRAGLCAARPGAAWTVRPEAFKSRGKNSPFAGSAAAGKIALTIHDGRVVFDGR